MTRSQIVSAWIFAVLWGITLFIWYLGDSYNWGFSEFVQGTFFWVIFAALAHVTLGLRKVIGVPRVVATPHSGIADVSVKISTTVPLSTGKLVDEQAVNVTKTNSSQQEALLRARYFTVSLRRFVFYDLISCGLWSVYWFYRNWDAINKSGYKKRFSSVARAWFYPVTSFSLLKKLLHGASRAGYPWHFEPSTLATLIIVFPGIGKALERIPELTGNAGATWFVAIFSLLMLVSVPLVLSPAIRAIQYLKLKQGREPKDDNRITLGQIAFFIGGVCLWWVSFKAA